MKKLFSFLTAFVFIIVLNYNLSAQTANTYVFSTSTGASLEDMSGSTELIPSGTDDQVSVLTTFPSGFTFTYEGVAYTEFTASPDGFIKLGAPVATNQFTNSVTSTTNRPKLFPLWDDLATGTDGNVSYKLTGTTPNQTFIVQWFVTVPRNTSGAANSTYQLLLHESGVIEFVFGAGGNPTSASAGINSVAANATNFQSITTSTSTNSTSTANNSNTSWPGNGRKYTYDLPTQCAISIANLNPAGTQYPGCSAINVAPKVNISNGGQSGQTAITVTYAVPSESYSETVGAPDLAPGANEDVTFPATLSIDPNSPGTKNVTVTVNSTCNAGSEQYTLNTSYDVSTLNTNFGGPVFGYYFANSTSGASCAPDQPIYYWEDTTGSTSLIVNGIDVSGGLRVGSVDDGYFILGGILGGELFRYAGVDYDSFFVGTNGMIAFSRANNTQSQLTTFSPLAIPDVNAPRPAMFPMWKDFNFGDADVPINRLSYKVVPGKLIITYDNAPNYNTGVSSDEYLTFQVILETSPVPVSDGIIITQFSQDLTGEGFLVKYYDGTLANHTVGIQNLAGDEAIQYRRANPVTGGPLFGSNMALSFGIDNNALPVELASFTSSVNGRDVTLNWATASELNNSGFDVERSSDGTWTRVATVSGNGTSTAGHSYAYTDRNVASGTYSYRLKQIDFNGNFEYFNLNNEVNVGIPNQFALSQNYPNPFNPSTKINYDLPTDSKVSIKLFDMSGREVMTLVNEVKTAGYYSVTFNGSNLSSGIYFYTISAGNFVSTKKMTLIK